MQQFASQMLVQGQMQAMARQQQQQAQRQQALARYRESQRQQRVNQTANAVSLTSMTVSNTTDDRWTHLHERAAERRRLLDERIQQQQVSLSERRARAE